jgi:2-hydroxy-6-oxonona-2,4-dienedioate hydrolase
MRVKFAEIAGVTTRYYYEGSGPAILLLHGAGVSADVWLRNIDTLAQDFSVYAPDTLGHGFTGSGDYISGPPQPAMVEHLVHFVDYLGVDRFAAIGSSFGALIAALLYFRFPDRVEKLVLGSSGSIVNSDEEFAEGLQAAYRNGLSAIEGATPESCRRRLGRIFHDPSAVPEELILMQLTINALPDARESYERRFRGLMDIAANRPYRIIDRLEQITVPTLLLWGRNDMRGRYERALDAAMRIPKSQLVALDDSGHHPHMEHPEKFNALVREFVAR